MLAEKGSSHPDGSIAGKIKSVALFFREAWTGTRTAMRERWDYRNQVRQIELRFHGNLMSADTGNTASAALSVAKNELDDLFIRQMSTRPRPVQKAVLEQIEADAKRFEGIYRGTGNRDQRTLLETSTRLANRMRLLMGKDQDGVDKQLGITR